MRSLGEKLPSAIRAMTGDSTNSQKMLLAVAIAEGTAVEKWASTNGVPARTTYHWAAQPEVESIRRRALDEAIGRMAKRATSPADGTAKLAKDAGEREASPDSPECPFVSHATG